MSPHYGASRNVTAQGGRGRAAALSSAGMAHQDEHGPAGTAEQITMIVDGANVMGSRADGWWRDRAGAMTRLHEELARLAARGVPDAPPGGGVPDGLWFPRIVLVVEGKARSAFDRVSPDPGVRVVAAARDGDEEIARLAGGLPGRRLVITADQELRRRCLDAGAEVTGPQWLLRLLR
jgi:8-oxo-dGTP diphosphatase